MNYNLSEIKDKDTWNNFLTENNFEFISFLSSWEWWDFQALAWKKVVRLWIYNNDKLVWLLPLIVNKAKRWTYLFAAHSPMILEDYSFFEVINWLIEEIKEIWKIEWADFIRFNSPVKNTKSNKAKFNKLGFIDAPMHEHAEDTHILDLSNSEEELFNNIKKGDRYYINRAKKEWVEIVKWNKKENIDKLKEMHKKHSEKVWYHAFSDDFIDNLYECFWDNITTIWTKYNWLTESILMTIKFWKSCVYYIAASDILNHKFSPNYLCQWEAIIDAKNKWCITYNFWWVSPDDNPKHPISWVTKFKRKFWWQDYSLLHAQDLPLTNKYWFNYLIETIRRKKRWYYYKKSS